MIILIKFLQWTMNQNLFKAMIVILILLVVGVGSGLVYFTYFNSSTSSAKVIVQPASTATPTENPLILDTPDATNAPTEAPTVTVTATGIPGIN